MDARQQPRGEHRLERVARAEKNATAIRAAVVAFERNAPRAIPGQTAHTAATATPDGGHMSVTVTPTVASVRPSFADRK